MRSLFKASIALAVACAHLGVAARARADEPPAPASVESAPDTVPVLIEAGGDYVNLGDALCNRGSCVARVARGRQRLVRRAKEHGAFVTTFEGDVIIDRPSVVGVSDPGALHTAATVGLVTGAALMTVAVVVLLVACSSSSKTDPTTREVSTTNPCAKVPDPEKVGLIGGLGVGITLTLVGAVVFAATNRPPRASVEPWRDPTAVRVTLAPLLEPGARAERLAASWGLALRVSF